MELYKKTAAELAEMLAAGSCTATEIVEDIYAQIDAVEGQVDAYLTLCREDALAQAAEIDRRRAAGEKLPPLAGVPIAVKDNICTEGVSTTCASKMLENFVPPYSATVVDKLRQAGLITIGKVNMDEFAMGSSCENSHFKKTKNPHDLTRVPGGSSGGSAAALAACEATLALGSDTGGSIRQPAAFCGVVGLKPTYGAVSRYGLVAFASSLDQIGPMGRSCEDVAMLLSVITGKDELDATSTDCAHRDDYRAYLDQDVAGMRVGLPKEYFGEGVSQEVQSAVLAAADTYRRLGAEVVEVSIPSTAHALSAYYIISSAEASSNLARFDGVKYGYRAKEYESLTDMYVNSRTEGFGDEVKRRIMLGTYVLSSGYFDAYYKKGKAFQRQLCCEFEQAFAQCDFLITPTVPTTAFKLGENVDDPVAMYKSDICTVTVNIAGLPALSMPCGKDAAGLPIGMQLIGPKFGEDKLLSAGHAYEKATGWHYALPQIG
ncbi:Asp-tRNA(Asn)/Glu-tRNA(Gln) amidotransferase subunit GatA [Neobittarella massiliensis]|uniref:Glutamyl-tRNA(Gln) amidotransferase subunit A n=2 Tax=Oscillospiraceae TaxID=216572 RepID=A0A8J6LYK1_9FIRM|nr:Asp-tRNA(Asn)/Glu-tRNA(Gln) amidotransferase subunit GatA [Neobittarella massiliensis]MBC3515732.1 Asp-tRNA(Asn)/Glu-tRNA(Gln) amidotransferase subunit GatA [Neobittarella massiliensis]SCJ47884.1 Glutamyl-tRNA(Gln) amidotransferase subunit A [uncultured Anaerotruncus sp.]